MKKKVLLTGASGSMGSAVLEELLKDKSLDLLILLRRKRRNEKLASSLKRKYGNSVEIVFGDLSNFDDCIAVVDMVDYIVHCGAIIPPAADHDSELTINSNYIGTRNLVHAAKEGRNANKVRFINIGSVAEYGNRNYPAHWGRVGDPLYVSAYDVYGCTKVRAERCVVESELNYWVSLRQSGVLYDKILFNNLNDGLVFHTPWNSFIEWATDRDSGVLIYNLIKKDMTGKLDPDFWRKCYNIGNGEGARVTGFETLERGINMLGRSAKEIFKPHWSVSRNFHCFWYLDSDKLEEYLEYRSETFESFFDNLSRKFWWFKLGKPFPRTISKLAIQRLFSNSNSPMYWLKNKEEGKVNAFYKSREEYEKLPRKWEDFSLIKSKDVLDFDSAKILDLRGKDNLSESDIAFLRDNEYRGENRAVILSHGYDETKSDEDLDITDMQAAAKFRGGKVLSAPAGKIDLYAKLEWECHKGHKFMASPYAILKAGFWCPECEEITPVEVNPETKDIPFFAQIWWNQN